MALRAPAEMVAKINPSVSARSLLKSMSCVAGASILGDLGCQTLESYAEEDVKFQWDRLRTMRMGITGAFVVAPMSLAWNLYAERLAPGSSFRAIATKIGVSVAVIPPMTATQFASLTLLEEGKTMEDVRRKLAQDLVPTCLNALCYWPLVSGLNVALVPVMNRPSFSSFAGVFWNIYLSYKANASIVEVGDVPVEYRLEETDAIRGAVSLSAEKIAVSKVGAGASQAKGGVGNDRADAGDEEDSPVERAKRSRRGKFVRRTSVVSM